MRDNVRSATQGISGKTVRVGKMLSDHGAQIISAKGKVEMGIMDNRGHKPRKLPFSSIKINELTFFKVGFSFLDSIVDNLRTFFKK